MTDDEVLTRASVIGVDGDIDLSFLKADYYAFPLEKYLSEKDILHVTDIIGTLEVQEIQEQFFVFIQQFIVIIS